MQDAILYIEAIIFTSENAVKKKELYQSLQQIEQFKSISIEEISKSIERLEKKYQAKDFAFELKKVGGGYQFLSKIEYHSAIALFANLKAKRKLSTAALETLSIIAYKQPVTKLEIEQIRGVSADYSIHRLLEKELVSILGKADKPGKPILYGVSQYFLDYFGINSIEEMPKLKEITPPNENTIGTLEE